MKDSKSYIASKGACIYCGKFNVPLSDEHIVPLSLGGNHIIRQASCRDCASITSKFEMDVARELWGDSRISYDAPSRRKKRRKTHITLQSPDGLNEDLTVPYTEYAPPMIFYKMGLAGFFQGLNEESDISNKWELIAIADNIKAQAFEKKYPGRLVAKFRHVPQSFGRLLAQIGYGNALTILDLHDFHPICLPYILGQKENVSFIVGSGTALAQPFLGQGYSMQTVFGGSPAIPNQAIIVTEVRLMANCFTPIYHVVVGYVTGQDQIKNAVQKFGPGNFFTGRINSKTTSFFEKFS